MGGFVTPSGCLVPRQVGMVSLGSGFALAELTRRGAISNKKNNTPGTAVALSFLLLPIDIGIASTRVTLSCCQIKAFLSRFLD